MARCSCSRSRLRRPTAGSRRVEYVRSPTGSATGSSVVLCLACRRSRDGLGTESGDCPSPHSGNIRDRTQVQGPMNGHAQAVPDGCDGQGSPASLTYLDVTITDVTITGDSKPKTRSLALCAGASGLRALDPAPLTFGQVFANVRAQAREPSRASLDRASQLEDYPGETCRISDRGPQASIARWPS